MLWINVICVKVSNFLSFIHSFIYSRCDCRCVVLFVLSYIEISHLFPKCFVMAFFSSLSRRFLLQHCLKSNTLGFHWFLGCWINLKSCTYAEMVKWKNKGSDTCRRRQAARTMTTIKRPKTMENEDFIKRSWGNFLGRTDVFDCES